MNDRIAGAFILLAMTGAFAYVQVAGVVSSQSYLDLLAELPTTNYVLLNNGSTSAEFLERASGPHAYVLWHFDKAGRTQYRLGQDVVATCEYHVYKGTSKVSLTGRRAEAQVTTDSGVILTAGVVQVKTGTEGNLTITTDLFREQAKQTIQWNPKNASRDYAVRHVCTDIGELPKSSNVIGSATGLPSGVIVQWPEVYDRVVSAKLTDSATAKDKLEVKFAPARGPQTLDPTLVAVNSTRCPQSFINLTNSYVSVVNGCSTYEMNNPLGRNQSWNGSNWRALFRNANDLNLRNVTDGLIDYEITIDLLQRVQRNETFTNRTLNCTQTRSVPNATYSCVTLNRTRTVQTNRTEVVRYPIEQYSATRAPNAKVNITVCSRRQPNTKLDNVPYLDLNGTNYACDNWDWYNTSWLNRTCWPMPNNQNNSIQGRDSELMYWNLSTIPGFACSNSTKTPCDEAVLVLNDSATNHREILFNITNNTAWGASSQLTGATTKYLFWLQNTTAKYAPSQFNATPCLYINNPAASVSPNHVGNIVLEFDSFEAGAYSGVWSETGTLTTNTSRSIEGSTSIMTNSALSDYLLTDTGFGNQRTAVVYMFRTEGVAARGYGIYSDAALTTCTLYNNISLETCAGTQPNQTIASNGWHTLKVTDIEAQGGAGLDYHIDGRFNAHTATSDISQIYVGEVSAGGVQNPSFDVFVASAWNLNMYAAKSNLSTPFIENQVAAPGNNPNISACPVLVNITSKLIADVNSTGSCITINGNNLVFDCAGYKINFSRTTNGAGVYSDRKTNISVINCTINAGNDSTTGTGVLLNSTNNTLVENVTYNSGGGVSSGILITQGNNYTIRNVSITTVQFTGMSMTGPINGFVINQTSITVTIVNGDDPSLTLTTYVQNGSIQNTSITNTGTSNNNHGIQLSANSSNNTLRNNIIRAAQSTSATHAINIQSGSNNNVLIGNNLTTTLATGTFGIRVNLANGTRINHTTFNTGQTTDFVAIDDSNVTLQNVTFASSGGQITFTGTNSLDLSNANASTNSITSARINTTTTRAFLNATILRGLNKTAQVQFNSVSMTDPRPTFDDNDDGAFLNCASPRCVEVSYVGTEFIYTVNSWSAYGYEETPERAPNSTFDGINDSAAYELGTNTTIRVDATEEWCMDVNNLVNHTCSTNTTYILELTWDKGWQWQFVNGTGMMNSTKNITNGTNVFFHMDDRWWVFNISVNLTGSPINGNYPRDVTLDMKNNGTDAILPGRLKDRLLEDYRSIYNNRYDSEQNVSFASGGTETFQLNMSSMLSTFWAAYNSSFNWTILTFNLSGIVSNAPDSQFEFNESFVNNSYTGTIRNITAHQYTYDDFENNWTRSTKWTNSSDCVATIRTCQYILDGGSIGDASFQLSAEGGSCGAENVIWAQTMPEYGDFKDIGNWTMNTTETCTTPTGGGYCIFQLLYSVNTGTVEVYNARFSPTETRQKVIQAARQTQNALNVSVNGVYNRTVDLTSIRAEGNISLRAQVTGGTTGGGGCPSLRAIGTMNIHHLNRTGVSLTRNASGFYNNTPGEYISQQIIPTPSTLTFISLNATDSRPEDTNITYYISANNGTNWEQIVTLGQGQSLANTGTSVRWRAILTRDNNNETPMIHAVQIKTVGGFAENLTIDVTNDGTTDYTFTGSVNDNVTINVSGLNVSERIKQYVVDNCNASTGSLTCLVPVKMTAQGAGRVKLGNLNLTTVINPARLNPWALNGSSSLTPFNVSWQAGGMVNLSHLFIDYFGTMNASLNFHTKDYQRNITKKVFIFFTWVNLTLPAGIDDFYVSAPTNNSKNLTPYGQNRTSPIYNITHYGLHDANMTCWLKVNESLPGCVRIGFSNNSDVSKTAVNLSTTQGMLYANATKYASCNAWAQVNLTNCAFNVSINTLTFRIVPMCGHCVLRPQDWK